VQVDDPTVPERPGTGSLPRPEGLPARYRLVQVIGLGGMGRVFRAHDTMLNRDVAIKVIDSGVPGTGGTQRRDRFVREARAAARLAHPNIVAVHDVDPDAGWLVMDLIEGESLREVVARGATPAPVARKLAEQVLGALDAAHANGVIHRDLKPSNLMVDRTGKLTLVDFGVARLVDAELTRTGESLGTPAYMAPEQLRGGAVDARTDLYGLAATIYELVSAERMCAFETPSDAALARVAARCADEPGLAVMITRCLQADPDARLASARDALATLAGPGPRRRRRWLVPAAVATIAAGGLAAGLIAWRSGESPVDPRNAEMFSLAQRGEHEKAGVLLEQYLASHPDDPDARTMKLLTDWWQTGRIDDSPEAIAPLRRVQREMVHGIALFSTRHEANAIAFLEEAQRQRPASVELAYALGEARWHGQMLDRGVTTLEHAFEIDPRWQMALHHVIEYRQSRGETAQLVPIVERLRAVDAASAAALECQIAIGTRDYAAAARLAAAAIEREQPMPALYVCLLQAEILLGDLDAAERTTRQAMARWPIDLREWGGHALDTELLLYRGELDAYLDLPDARVTIQRRLALALWRPAPDVLDPPIGWDDGTRGRPLGEATELLVAHALRTDRTDLYLTVPEPEIRAYGRGLAFELQGDPDAAIAEYRKALAVPSRGDIHMLVSYQLARLLHARGDVAGTSAACEEVISPRQYQGYRAILLPDCLAWSDDPARWRQLVDAWRSTFAHPAVVEARRRLAAAPP
jgi:tetratricopeptide (TPR) repeat protein